MTATQRIIAELPFLRRYARAILGAQQPGDAVVKAALTSIMAEPAGDSRGTISAETYTRIDLFRSLQDHLEQTVQAQREGRRMVVNENIVDEHLRTLSSKPRRALLLSVLEGFRAPEIAQVMRTDGDTVERWLEEAQECLVEQAPSKILIIEDEPIIALDIESILRSRGHHVTGIAQTREEAIKLARQEPPQLILADIQLADNSSGVDAANDILSELDIPVVFITAYPERLLTSERPEPAFLISKPFSDQLLLVTVSQALHLTKTAN